MWAPSPRRGQLLQCIGDAHLVIQYSDYRISSRAVRGRKYGSYDEQVEGRM